MELYCSVANSLREIRRWRELILWRSSSSSRSSSNVTSSLHYYQRLQIVTCLSKELSDFDSAYKNLIGSVEEKTKKKKNRSESNSVGGGKKEKRRRNVYILELQHLLIKVIEPSMFS